MVDGGFRPAFRRFCRIIQHGGGFGGSEVDSEYHPGQFLSICRAGSGEFPLEAGDGFRRWRRHIFHRAGFAERAVFGGAEVVERAGLRPRRFPFRPAAAPVQRPKFQGHCGTFFRRSIAPARTDAEQQRIGLFRRAGEIASTVPKSPPVQARNVSAVRISGRR